MSKIPGNISANDDEIDILKFIERVFRFFRANRVILISGIVLGILAGWALYAGTSKKYSATMMVQSSLLTNAEQIAIIESWNDLIKRGETGILTGLLSLPVEVTQKVYLIEAEEILKLYVEKNSIGFNIKVLVSDTTILDQLQTALVGAMANNSYVKTRTDARKADLKSLISQGNKEMTSLDSTKAGIQKMMRAGNGPSSSIMVDVSDFNVQTLELTEKILLYEDELRFIAPIKILQEFVKYSQPEEPKFMKSLVIGGITGFLLSYFIAFSMGITAGIKRGNASSI